jgi:hypothetical protein
VLLWSWFNNPRIYLLVYLLRYYGVGLTTPVFIYFKMQSVSILASFCVWTKSLICKDAANRNSTVQSEVRRISKFPVNRPDDVSSRPDTHLSTAPSVRTMCHPVRTPDSLASSVRTTCFFRPDTSLYREASVPACSVRTFQQHVPTPISSRTVH